MGAVVWTNLVNVSAAGATITKTGGVDGTWDAGASSSQTIVSGDGYVTITAADLSHAAMFGLSHTDPNQDFATIQYAFFLSGNGSGTLSIYESGTYINDFGTYAPGDVLKVSVESGAVKYYNGASLKRTSGTAPTMPLLLDASIKTAAGTLNSAVIFPTAGGLIPARGTTGGMAVLNGGMS